MRMPMRWPRDRFVLLTLLLNAVVNCSEFGGLEPPDDAAPRGGSKSWGAGGTKASGGNGKAAAGASPRTAGGMSGGRSPSGGAATTVSGFGGLDGSAGSNGPGGSNATDHAGQGGVRSSGGAAGSAGPGGSAGSASGASAGVASEAGAAGALPTGAALGPFISEMIEGTSLSGNIKALEISVRAEGSLNGCRINIYANGAREHNRAFALSEVVTPTAPLVICSPGLDSAACQRRETLPFNGNDAILLLCAGTIADSFGTLGQDPKDAGWRADGVTTTDTTLRRRCESLTGDLNPDDEFVPNAEWWTPGTDVTDGLGTHCTGTPGSDAPLDANGGAGGIGGTGGTTPAPTPDLAG